MSYSIDPREAVAHLQPAAWEKVNRLQIRKMIAEFAHEQIITPAFEYAKEGWNYYVLAAESIKVVYHFRAKILQLRHWYIDTPSIKKLIDGVPAALDALAFIVEFNEQMNMDPALLPVYMEEVSATLYGSAYIHTQDGPTAAYLATASYQETEHAMT
ncbi:MAG TPA: IucA/IucC family siderophore biosynthesis protein, partial [Chitinophaga sp.]